MSEQKKKPGRPPSDTVTRHVTLPREVAEAVERAIATTFRSFSKEVEVALRKHLKEHLEAKEADDEAGDDETGA